jgi:hypothetical protein
MRCKKGELDGGRARSDWGRNGARRKGGDGGHSDPFETSAAVRAIGERGAWGAVWRRGRGAGMGRHRGRPAATHEWQRRQRSGSAWTGEGGG